MVSRHSQWVVVGIIGLLGLIVALVWMFVLGGKSQVKAWMLGSEQSKTIVIQSEEKNEEHTEKNESTPEAPSSVSEPEPSVVVQSDPTPQTSSKNETTPVTQPTPVPEKESSVPDTPMKTSQGGDAGFAKNRLVSFGFSSGRSSVRAIDTIVIHSTYNAIGGDVFDVSQVIEEYRQAGVSPHYLISRDGTVYLLVHERDIAWHAGESKMKDGRKNVNEFSIGIEVIGTKTSGYTDKQYSALKKLIGDIRSRHTIAHIVGHDDIAPDRKTDPWMFDWDRI